MFGSAAIAGSIGSSKPFEGGDRSTSLIQKLNAAAVDGDNARVRGLLTQLLYGRARASEQPAAADTVAQLAAVEHLFYAMRTLATTDTLTGVNNPRGFELAANRLLQHLAPQRRGALLLYVDVNDLKAVNDAFGHAVGDGLLMATSKVLRSACGASAIIGRIGGDEFALLARKSDAEGITLLRQRIDDAVAECNSEGRYPPLAISIGIAEFEPLCPATVVALLDRAERAMQAQKIHGKTFATARAHLAPAATGG